MISRKKIKSSLNQESRQLKNSGWCNDITLDIIEDVNADDLLELNYDLRVSARFIQPNPRNDDSDACAADAIFLELYGDLYSELAKLRRKIEYGHQGDCLEFLDSILARLEDG